jgi:tyrosine-protein kinase Etk/Wzc
MSHKENFDSVFVNDEKQIDFKQELNRYLYHWPVFIIGILVCLFAAAMYLRYSQPVYSITSTLLLKDEKKGGVASGNDLLNEIDLFGTSKVVDNEIEILKSKTLMTKVIERLNLSVTFQSDGRVKSADLYAEMPVNFKIIDIDSTYYNRAIQLSFPNANTYMLNDEVTGKKITGPLGALQRNFLGVYRIDKTDNLSQYLDKSIRVQINDPLDVVDQVLSKLDISLSSKQSTVLNLQLQSTVPEKGRDILNTLIQVYNEASLADKNRTTESTLVFIDERLKLISGELSDVEKNVEQFKSARGLTDLSSDASVFLDNVKSNDSKLNEINLRISVVRNIQKYLNSERISEDIPSTLGIDDPVLLNQLNQLSQMQLQLDKLLSTTTENNPLVAPLKRQIDLTKQAVATSVDNIQQSLEISRSGLLKNSLEFRGAIKKIPGQERQLISIKRQQSIKESLYLYLLQKKEEAALSYASSVADSRIVDGAYYSKFPVSPKRTNVYLMAFLMGLILPVAYVYGKGLLNDKVENVENLSKLTSAPILGQVSLSDENIPIVVQVNSRKAIAEQFRSIRTNMQFLRASDKKQGNVTLFTSGMSGEGKTFVASNIAAAYAMSGKKTVLLEFDLRKPKVSKYLNLSNGVGLSNYLIGQTGINDILQTTDIDPRLFVIGSGPIPPNPSELISEKTLETLFDYLRQNFDEVLIDTPPIGLVTDAQLLARVADATIYLVRQGVTYKQQVKNVEELFRNGKMPKLNVILNGIKTSAGYGYGYGAGYGYGYYADDQKSTSFSLNNIVKNILNRF